MCVKLECDTPLPDVLYHEGFIAYVTSGLTMKAAVASFNANVQAVWFAEDTTLQSLQLTLSRSPSNKLLVQDTACIWLICPC